MCIYAEVNLNSYSHKIEFWILTNECENNSFSRDVIIWKVYWYQTPTYSLLKIKFHVASSYWFCIFTLLELPGYIAPFSPIFLSSNLVSTNSYVFQLDYQVYIMNENLLMGLTLISICLVKK